MMCDLQTLPLPNGAVLSEEKITGKDKSSTVVEFVTEKHAQSFNKLQKICILVTDQVATGSVKQS